MSWWQKKLLHYALAHTGILDADAIKPENLDISLGRRNVIELRNVGLNKDRICSLLSLPAELRIASARIVRLRLAVPADIYQTPIVAEADDIELTIDLTPQHAATSSTREQPPPASHRRPPHGTAEGQDDAQLPSAQDMARSFLMQEPAQSKEELAASVLEDKSSVDDLYQSQSSDGDDVGVGTPVGLPRFLANFLQGIIDRLQVNIKGVEIRVNTHSRQDRGMDSDIGLRLRIDGINLGSVTVGGHPGGPQYRPLDVGGIVVELLSSQPPNASSSPIQPTDTVRRPSPQVVRGTSHPSALSPTPPPYELSTRPVDLPQPRALSSGLNHSNYKESSVAEDAREAVSPDAQDVDFGIKAGDDNISWNSRKSSQPGSDVDLWSEHSAFDQDLCQSLAFLPTLASEASAPDGQPRRRRRVSPYGRRLQSAESWPMPERRQSSPSREHSMRSWPSVSRERPAMPYAALQSNTDFHERYDPQVATSFRSNVSPDVHNAGRDDSTDSNSSNGDPSMYYSIMPDTNHLGLPSTRGRADTDAFTSSNLAGSRIFARAEESAQSTLPASRPESVASTIGLNSLPQQDSDPAHLPSLAAKMTIKRLMVIQFIKISIPASAPTSDQTIHPPSDVEYDASDTHTQMPGTFSLHQDGTHSTSFASFHTSTNAKPGMLENTGDDLVFGAVPRIEVDMGHIEIYLELHVARILLTQMLPIYSEVSQIRVNRPPPKKDLETVGVMQNSRFTISLTCEKFSIYVDGPVSPNMNKSLVEQSLLQLDIEEIRIRTQPGGVDVNLGHIRVRLLGTSLLTFDSKTPLHNTSFQQEQPDLSIRLDMHKYTTNDRKINEFHIESRLLKLNVDIAVIEQGFSALASDLDVTILSSYIGAINKSSSGRPARPAKGVRFEQFPDAAPLGDELKLNLRIHGALLNLEGKAASVQLESSTIKAVYREHGVKATIEHIRLSGPYQFLSRADAPFIVSLSSLKIDYSLTPKDQDLERLLLLLTPSRDKYDTDDDILLDTLLRQRRQGAVARVQAGKLLMLCNDIQKLDLLAELGQEFGRLTVFTKYLPEDDRPGLLSLVRIDAFEAHVPLNRQFGVLELILQSIDVAHVGLPLLVASSVSEIRVRQLNGREVLHPLIEGPPNESGPMIMARMLGNEEEPTIKIKVFNTCAEYSVPLLLDILAKDQAMSTDAAMIELAQSVVELTSLGPENSTDRDSTVRGEPQSKLNLVVLIHDTAVGLSPLDSPSKAMFVLTDAKITVQVPPAEKVCFDIELRKAALWITDRVNNQDTALHRRILHSSVTGDRVISNLTGCGYVPVGSIMSAKIKAKIWQAASDETPAIEVDASNELLLLESCADSTQTMIALFSGLAPPAAPAKQPVFHTEPMTIEDMVNSFSGDAFPSTVHNTHKVDVLFDTDDVSPEASENPDDFLLSQSIAEEDLEIEVSEPSSSFYQSDEKFDHSELNSNSHDNWNETAESLLEEDPFVMAISGADELLSSDALLRDLRKQCKPAISNDVVSLTLLDRDGPSILPNSTRPTPTSDIGPRSPLPFQLHVRDVHFIWNLHDGYDWRDTRDGIAEAVEQVEARAEERKQRRRRSQNSDGSEEPIIEDFLFNSIYIGIPSHHDTSDLRRQINRGIDELVSDTETASVSGYSRQTTTIGRPGQAVRHGAYKRRLKLERSRTHKIAFEIKGLSADIISQPTETSDVIATIEVRVRDFEIFDNVPTSTWRKFLTCMDIEREMGKPMMHLEVDNIRTLRDYAAVELAIRVTLLPLRLHVDQDALDFITRFFAFKDSSPATASDPNAQPFLQRVEVNTVNLCLDYKPKRIDYVGLRSGHTTEFMNFITLEGTNIRLQHAIIYGLRGFDPLHKSLNDVWMPDVRQNQLPTVLAGLAPVRSLVNIGSGIRDIVAIPIREYQKDGRIVRSIQKGAVTFGKTTTSEIARLGAKVTVGAQNLLQGAEVYLSSGAGGNAASSSGAYSARRAVIEQDWRDGDDVAEQIEEQRAISAYADQPVGVIAGLQSARRRLEYDLLTARDAVIAVQGEIVNSSGPGAMLSAVARNAPTVLLRPVIGASRAVSTTLMGVANQIDRDNLRRVDDVSTYLSSSA